MNGHNGFSANDDFSLRRQLRELATERAPGRDLWGVIEAALPAQTRLSPKRSWHAPLALAAALVLAVILVPSLQTPPAPPPVALNAGHDGVRLDRSAAALSAEYRAAFAEIAAAPLPAHLQAAAYELNLSARDLRDALRQQPDSVALLNQLRRTYEMRLRLSQRATLS